MKNTKELKKRQTGITLIALVITIIVLLILAGVGIAMLTGNNGILTQANNAKILTENKSAEEKVKLAIISVKSQTEDAKLDLEKLTTEITTNYGGQVEGEAFPVTVTIDRRTFTVDSDGNVVSKDNKIGGKVTIVEGNGKNTGDVIAVTSTKDTTEEFYVLSYDEKSNTVKALAKWNLKVGGIYNGDFSKIGDIDTSEDKYGLQDETMKGFVDEQERKGTVVFANDEYWSDANKYPSKTSEHLSDYPWVYNAVEKECTISQYVELYKKLLGNTDKIREVSLASYEDISALWSNRSKYPWLCSTSFWLGSACSSSSTDIWHVNSGDSFNGYGFSGGSYYGVRPVIIVNISKI